MRAPLHANPARITAFLQEKSSWIDQARAKMLNVEAQAEPYRYEEGRPIWFLGRQYLLRIVSRVKGGLIFDPDQGFLLEKGMQSRGAALLARFYKQETRRVVTDLVTKYVRSEGFNVSGIRITSARTRWGSCSGNNSLNFSYRLAMTPPECIEYVVVHELAHTRVRNHSAQYWEQVRRILPGFKRERDWLKQHSLSLPRL